MTRNTGLLACLPLFFTVGCHDQTAVLERRLERTFQATPGSTVRVELAGGSVTAETGPPGQVHVSIRQAVYTDDGEAAANRVLADYRVDATQEGREILVVGRRKNLLSWARWRERVELSATVTAPPDIVLDLGTSGGRISVRGDRTAPVKADTSGGSVSADGGTADLRLNTSGGSIRVARVLGRLNADTSGGGINVGYVGPTARDVVLTTSGGSIRVGVDPKASLAVDAGTSGGSVRVEDLPFEVLSHGRSHASGTINGGSNRLRASTSGGGISIRGVGERGQELDQ
jgi:hypothetical protein